MAKNNLNRRGFLKTSITASTGAALGFSFEERNLLDRQNRPASTLKPTSAGLPMGKIKDVELSRMICGGNLMGGWAHSRDLTYASDLVKAYHTEQKIFETLDIAEANGINTILTNPVMDPVMNEYWKQTGGKIQFITDLGWGRVEMIEGIKRSVDNGACAAYFHGGLSDTAAQNGRVDQIGEVVENIKKYGIPAGIGGHLLSTIQLCVDEGLEPDFWMKTLHHDNYWSATPEEERSDAQLPPNDNMFCTNAEETIAYMASLEQPWIAFKILAAGAIRPRDGFRYAFENGADFICVGMFDFQVEENVAFAEALFEDPELDNKRPRPWRA